MGAKEMNITAKSYARSIYNLDFFFHFYHQTLEFLIFELESFFLLKLLFWDFVLEALFEQKIGILAHMNSNKNKIIVEKAGRTVDLNE